MKFQNTIARTVSIIFNPLLMPTVGVILLLNCGTFLTFLPAQIKNLILLITLLSTLVLPSSLVPFLYYRGILNNLDIENPRKRVLPAIITLIMYTIGYFWVFRYVPSGIIKSFWLGFTYTVALVLMVSVFWKISAHMAGIGGVTGLLVCLFIRYNIDIFPYFIMALAVAGLLAYSRLKLEAHNGLQIFTGYAAGVFIVVITMLRF